MLFLYLFVSRDVAGVAGAYSRLSVENLFQTDFLLL